MINKAIPSNRIKTIIITGATDGIGKELASNYLNRGWRVVVIGRNTAKGELFLKEAATNHASDRAYFICADLSLISENHRVIQELTTQLTHIDVLVLGAQHYRTTRLVTSEGLENTFALYYLSRYLLSWGFVDLMQQASDPLIINVCGTGMDMGEILWTDLQRKDAYDGFGAMMQASRLNDLLGVAFTKTIHNIRYVLFNPGGVATSFSGEYDEESKLAIEAMQKVATPLKEGVKPIIDLIDTPPVAQLSAWIVNESVDLTHTNFNLKNTKRLEKITKSLLDVKVVNNA